MSTNDVPGANPANNDVLAMGCWAEHKDGSLIFVTSTENDRVIYSVFDMATQPITEYRDAMPIDDFEDKFSWKGNGDQWTWHDKTPFPWNKVIKEGAKDGLRFASVEDQLTAAARVARSRDLMGDKFKPEDHAHRVDHMAPKSKGVLKRIQNALNALAGK